MSTGPGIGIIIMEPGFTPRTNPFRGMKTLMNESIRAVERALNILLCFSINTPELSMTQISEQVGLHKSTVHRLLGTLERMRFVERDPVSAMYRPGIRLLQMAFLTLEHNDLRRVALPYMHRLRDAHRETVDLSAMDGAEVIYVEAVESPQRVKLAATTGQRLPAFCTASGKSIMAFFPDEKIQQLLEQGMPKYTPCTPQNPEFFMREMTKIREQGFAISVEEFEEGINAVSAPIFDSGRSPIASLAIAGPAYRLSRERMIQISPDLVAACQSISRELQMSNSAALAPVSEMMDADEQED